MSSNFDKIHPRVDIRPYELGESIPEFDCGKSWFNDFINTDEVENYQRNRLGKTKLLYFDDEFAAFFCLCPSSMTDNDYNENEADGASKLYEGIYDMPARLLGHVAVDEGFQGEGIGEYLVKHILADTIESDTPFRVVILHSHDDVIGFYQKYGFVKAFPNGGGEDSDTTLMFYDLGRITDADL